MKRLRTLSIKNPEALDRRNWRNPWGASSVWRNRNARKQREYTQLMARRAHAQLQAMLAAARPLDDVPLAPQDIELPAKVVH